LTNMNYNDLTSHAALPVIPLSIPSLPADPAREVPRFPRQSSPPSSDFPQYVSARSARPAFFRSLFHVFLLASLQSQGLASLLSQARASLPRPASFYDLGPLSVPAHS